MRGIVLEWGTDLPSLRGVPADRIARVPERPGKADVDAVLADADSLDDGAGADVTVVGNDADLAAVVLRLLRTDRLAGTSVGFVPAHRRSAVAALWGLPSNPGKALELAVGSSPTAVPLIRDDKGGVLLGRADFGAVRGEAYCDDTRAFRGVARRIQVTPDATGGGGVVAHVTVGTWRRRSATFAGRAFQLGCVPATPTIDGVPQVRAAPRWTWYRHTEDLLLVR